MNLDRDFITSALDFYGIADEQYRNRCLDAASAAEKDAALYQRSLEVFNTLYYGHDDDRYAVRKKTPDALFGAGTPEVMTSVIVLAGVDIHKANMERFGLDEEQIQKHIMRVNGVLTDDLRTRKKGYIRPSQMQWGTNFSLVKLIELGRLQFERWPEKPGIVNMHIPAGGPLTREAVFEAVALSKTELERYFGIKDARYECESWLLSSEVREIAGDGSNIAAFCDMFSSHPFDDATEEILDYIWDMDECDDFSLLPENTSLQRKMKKALMSGKPMFTGEGVFIETV